MEIHARTAEAEVGPEEPGSAVGPVWTLTRGDGPVLVAAVHDGHEVRPELEELLALDEEERRREEDPLTGLWTSVSETSLRVHRSRFEVDLNRPRDRAVYRSPEDAWGLEVWKRPLPREIVEQSLAEYDAFYRMLTELLDEMTDRHGKVCVLDLHSYNHRRDGPVAPPAAPPAAPAANPEVNVATATLPAREPWAPLIDRFLEDLRSCWVDDHHLDVRENVKFFGGELPKWIHRTYPDVCTLSVEFKKFFMDEWRSTADLGTVEELRLAVRSTLGGIEEELAKL